MRGIDWVGVVLLGALGVGGAVYFVKTRPLEPQGYAQPGYSVPVVAQGQNFVEPQRPVGAGSTGGQDATNVINAVSGLATSLFGQGGFGKLF